MSLTERERAYHESRTRETADKLTAALERMRAGRTLRLPPDFRWSKRSWADEAGVNKDTPFTRTEDGERQFAKELAVFEQLRKGRTPGPGRMQRLLDEIATLRDENMRLKRALLGRSGGVMADSGLAA